MIDADTIQVYNDKAEEYRQMVTNDSESVALKQFMSAVAANGYILDLGCGPASSSAMMRNNGFHVDPVDASPEMVKIANEAFDINRCK